MHAPVFAIQFAGQLLSAGFIWNESQAAKDAAWLLSWLLVWRAGQQAS